MTTYTLAIGADMLLATVPDGGDIGAAVEAEAQKAGFTIPVYDAVHGCTLIDDEPSETARVIWESGNEGWIFDETGRDWRYAIVEAA